VWVHVLQWENHEAELLGLLNLKGFFSPNTAMGSLPIDVYLVGFEVLMVVNMKMSVFWVLAPCSHVEVYIYFRCSCSLHP
jgi:hypothetical protein